EGDTEQQEDAQEEAVEEPEAIFESNCASCHGDDLSGGMGPDLTDVGSRLSEEEIHEIIMEGKGDMPPGLATDAESEVLSEWLSDMEEMKQEKAILLDAESFSCRVREMVWNMLCNYRD